MLYNSILFLHIFFAILWVGGVMFIGWGVFPATKNLSGLIRQKVINNIMSHAHLPLALLGLAVITTGVLLGVWVGPINSVNSLITTNYGKRFMLAGVIGVATLAWGTWVSYPMMKRVLADSFIWQQAEKGHELFMNRQLFKAQFVASIEGIGFMTLLYLMVF
ncbi:hypothetical protein [Alkalibacillus salilacus]|uniref:Membrane protein n=1 Tax=Alkalibacillus salilacus TaxID=284582 RepID=A0ABT9VBC5_9BACI|nr:hypothetical protein [Alkalibacillus salilacus]MDQ0158272.1 putative membrane protein [Alkalibacillus salilacus]